MNPIDLDAPSHVNTFSHASYTDTPEWKTFFDQFSPTMTDPKMRQKFFQHLLDQTNQMIRRTLQKARETAKKWRENQ